MTDKEQFETLDNGLLVRAPAKINLSLLIAGKRPDGFHEIETVMAKINFYDEILIEPGQKADIELLCKGPNWAPEGKENLVYQAAQLLLENYKSQADIKITLTKNIPAGSGLGSASSDAAAALIGLNKYLNLGLSANKLAELAVQLGSDVPFFLGGPLAFCSGKGEKIKKIRKKFDFLALLIFPNVSVSTKRVYENYKHDPALYKELSTQINKHLDKNRIDLTVKVCANMLLEGCFSLVKHLAEQKAKIESLGIRPVCLSGSGTSMFNIIENGDVKKAEAYRDKLERQISCKSIIVNNNRW